MKLLLLMTTLSTLCLYKCHSSTFSYSVFQKRQHVFIMKILCIYVNNLLKIRDLLWKTVIRPAFYTSLTQSLRIRSIFLESTLNLEHFQKNWASYLKYFWNYWLWKIWLLICRKAISSYFFIILSQIELRKVIFSLIGDFRTAWWQVHYAWPIFSS